MQRATWNSEGQLGGKIKGLPGGSLHSSTGLVDEGYKKVRLKDLAGALRTLFPERTQEVVYSGQALGVRGGNTRMEETLNKI